MNSLFEQARGVRFNCAAMSGGLTGELGLNLRSDVNGYRHGVPLS
jgi:hypothetical protein